MQRVFIGKFSHSKLWIQYIHYINIVKQFIRAEHTGSWQNHLMVVRQMLNLFSATAHFQYAKSAKLYLQLMDELPIDFPWLYNLLQLEDLTDFGQDFGQT